MSDNQRFKFKRDKTELESSTNLLEKLMEENSNTEQADTGSKKQKSSKRFYGGYYWSCYTSWKKDNSEGIMERNNIALLLTVSPAALRLYFVILYLLDTYEGKRSEFYLSFKLANEVLGSIVGDKETSAPSSICRTTYYSALKELIKIDFIRSLGTNYYKVNACFLANGKDDNPERW